MLTRSALHVRPEKNSRSGFTLIELLVVIAIIAILIAILLPALREARSISKRVSVKANVQQLMVAYKTYSDDHGGALLPGRAGFSPNLVDDQGQQLGDEMARLWVWRLAPYLGYDLRTLVIDKGRFERYSNLPNRPLVQNGYQDAFSNNPSFGLNSTYIGGRGKFGAFPIKQTTQMTRPSMLIVFASARAGDYNQGADSSPTVPGYHLVNPPRLPRGDQTYQRDTYTWDPSREPGNYGFLDLRYKEKAIVGIFDGHVESLGLIRGEYSELRDSRRWYPQAEQPDGRDLFPNRF